VFPGQCRRLAPKYEEKLLRQLQRSHIAPPARNRSGRLPLD